MQLFPETLWLRYTDFFVRWSECCPTVSLISRTWAKKKRYPHRRARVCVCVDKSRPSCLWQSVRYQIHLINIAFSVFFLSREQPNGGRIGIYVQYLHWCDSFYWEARGGGTRIRELCVRVQETDFKSNWRFLFLPLLSALVMPAIEGSVGRGRKQLLRRGRKRALMSFWPFLWYYTRRT